MKPSERTMKAMLSQNPGQKIDPTKRQRTIDLVNFQMLQQTIRVKKSYPQRIWEQMPYISPVTWGMQLALLLGLVFLTSAVDARTRIGVLSTLAPLVGLIGFSEIIRSFSHNMWELEQACCYNLKQLIGMKLFIFGSIDFLMIGSMITIMGEKQMSGSLTIMLILIPFNIANAVYLSILRVMHTRCSNYMLLGIGIVMAGFVSHMRELTFMNEEMYRMLSSPKLTVLSSVMSLSLTGFMSYHYLSKLNKEEKVEWNFG